MASQNQFTSPLPSDLFLGLIGSDALYTDGSKPVSSCAVVNLPGFIPEVLMQLKPSSDIPMLNKYNNPILTYLDPSNKAIINYTLSGDFLSAHFLSAGRVIRKVVQTCEEVQVITIGEGISDNLLDVATKWINYIGGPILFNQIDARLKNAFEDQYKP